MHAPVAGSVQPLVLGMILFLLLNHFREPVSPVLCQFVGVSCQLRLFHLRDIRSHRKCGEEFLSGYLAVPVSHGQFSLLLEQMHQSLFDALRHGAVHISRFPERLHLVSRALVLSCRPFVIVINRHSGEIALH